ncbi:MAG: biotin/lipoate--protein ligase family protein [Roseinatronobacter sp.]
MHPISEADPPLLLPPPYTLHRSDTADVLSHAVSIAPEHGAGTLVLYQGPGLLAFAVVLEPTQKLELAQMAFALGMVALADALAAHCPPERSVRLIWPDEIRYDKARLGGGSFAVPPNTKSQDVPDWMVFAAELIADRDHLKEPGHFPLSTSLKEEAFDPAEDIISTFASYMMLYFDRWMHDGLDAVTNRYLMRIDPPLLRGVRRIEGDRLVEITTSGGGKRSGPMLSELNASGWRDQNGPVV